MAKETEDPYYIIKSVHYVQKNALFAVYKEQKVDQNNKCTIFFLCRI